MEKLILMLALLSPLAQASTLTSHIWAGEAKYPNHRIQTGHAESGIHCKILMFRLYKATAKDVRLTYAEGTKMLSRRWVSEHGSYHYEIAVQDEKGGTKFTVTAKCMPTTF